MVKGRLTFKRCKKALVTYKCMMKKGLSNQAFALYWACNQKLNAWKKRVDSELTIIEARQNAENALVEARQAEINVVAVTALENGGGLVGAEAASTARAVPNTQPLPIADGPVGGSLDTRTFFSPKRVPSPTERESDMETEDWGVVGRSSGDANDVGNPTLPLRDLDTLPCNAIPSSKVLIQTDTRDKMFSPSSKKPSESPMPEPGPELTMPAVTASAGAAPSSVARANDSLDS